MLGVVFNIQLKKSTKFTLSLTRCNCSELNKLHVLNFHDHINFLLFLVIYIYIYIYIYIFNVTFIVFFFSFPFILTLLWLLSIITKYNIRVTTASNIGDIELQNVHYKHFFSRFLNLTVVGQWKYWSVNCISDL